jgi:prepilin-type N-terminal cleavage/methylation domain-containing protein
MKLSLPFSGRGRSRMRNQGFTLPEILIALMIFLFMIAGIISANLFGLKMFQVTETKLNVSRWSRETTERLMDEVHGCHSAQVGSVTNGTFEAVLNGEIQQGTGLLIYPTSDTNSYVLYFLDPTDQTFRRTTDQPGTAVVLADSITNATPFSAQDFSGNVLTNNLNNQLIHLTLEFYQPQRFMQRANYYKLETAVKARASH